MDKIEIIELFNFSLNENEKHVIIDRDNGEFTSMLKSTYDELIANEAKTK